MSMDRKNFSLRIMQLFGVCIFISIAAGNVFLGLACACFLFGAYKRDVSFELIPAGYCRAIGIFIFTMLLSAVFSGNILQGLKAWGDLWIWRLMPFVIITTFLNEKTQAEKIFWAACAGMTAAVGMVLYQGAMGMTRANGFFGHPMTFAGFSCVLLPIVFICFLECRSIKKKLAVLALLMVMCLAAGFNGTRGAWLGVSAGFIVALGCCMLKNKKQFLTGLLLLALIGGGFMLNTGFVKRAQTIPNLKMHTERLLIWESARNMFFDHPVLGVGLGQYKDNYQHKYILPEAKGRELSHAHNNFLQMLAENGIIGFLGFIGMFFYIMIDNFRCYYQQKNKFALMILSATVALLVQGLTEYNAGNSAVMKVYWLLTGCLLILREYNNAAGGGSPD